MSELPLNLDESLAEWFSSSALPGRSAQERFAPGLCYGRHFCPPPHNARPAAVIMALYRTASGWHLPLTKRPAKMKDHGGQICLPGGSLDKNETHGDAAVRELEEELGIARSQVRLLGSLTPLNLFVSNFSVTSFVAVVEGEHKMIPNPDEVELIIEAPLRRLIDPEHQGVHTRTVGPSDRAGWSYQVPYIDVDGQKIWGATAVILGELIEIVMQIRNSAVT